MKNPKNAANHLAKECMVTALIQLLGKKNLSEISVTELTAKAGVSRMTFYRNYETKEDIFIQYLDDIFSTYRREFETQDKNTEFYDISNMLHCFHYFSVHKIFLDTLFKSGMGDLFLKKLSEYVLSVWYHNDNKTRYYTLQAFTGSLYNVYLTWSSNSSSFSEIKLANTIHDIYGHS